MTSKSTGPLSQAWKKVHARIIRTFSMQTEQQEQEKMFWDALDWTLRNLKWKVEQMKIIDEILESR